jgi:hypothetical protein
VPPGTSGRVRKILLPPGFDPRTVQSVTKNEKAIFFCAEGPRSRSYGRTAALRLLVQPCDEDERSSVFFFFIFTSNGTPVE